MSKRASMRGPRSNAPSAEDWIEVLTTPTTGPVVAGRFNGVGKNSSYKACKEGDFEAFMVGGQWRVPTESILQRIGLTTAEAREAALIRAKADIAAREPMAA